MTGSELTTHAKNKSAKRPPSKLKVEIFKSKTSSIADVIKIEPNEFIENKFFEIKYTTERKIKMGIKNLNTYLFVSLCILSNFT